jgi:ribosome biogenesis GTPase
MRIASVHRDRVSALSERGPVRLTLSAQSYTSDIAVGDWVLAHPETRLLVRRLERRMLLQRKTEGSRPTQLIAANVDTLLIVTSCNDDFNPARLERYLALVNEAGATPVIVLTKIDQTADAAPYLRQAQALQQGVEVVMLNATDPEAALTLAPWCGPGQTVALVGSSGVGKSTLLNTLSQKSSEDAQPTGPIREADAKGRHTTTSRSLHAIAGGGWVIDTPGMRTLHVRDVTAGLNTLFAEIVELASRCRFRDCTHDHEPGCAVQGAAADGTLDPARLVRWRKLTAENQTNTPIQSGPRGNKITRPPGKQR